MTKDNDRWSRSILWYAVGALIASAVVALAMANSPPTDCSLNECSDPLPIFFFGPIIIATAGAFAWGRRPRIAGTLWGGVLLGVLAGVPPAILIGNAGLEHDPPIDSVDVIAAVIVALVFIVPSTAAGLIGSAIGSTTRKGSAPDKSGE
jgi:peptidoglycan/LPS O-acetylase OafA/YrhL